MKIEEKSITWLRAIATLMVVAVHVFDIMYFNPNAKGLYRFLILGFHSFFRVPVPIFAMISGYLLWNRNIESSLTLAF